MPGIIRRVGPRFRRNAIFLKKLKNTKSHEKRMNIIGQAAPGQIFSIIDAAHNILNGNFPINSRQKRQLLPYKDQIRYLSRAKTFHKARDIIQRGDGVFLNALLAPILAELAKFVVKKVIKKFSKSETDTDSTQSS